MIIVMHIYLSVTITLPNKTAAGAAANNMKNIIIENYAPFTNCICKIINTQIDHVKDIDIDTYDSNAYV